MAFLREEITVEYLNQLTVGTLPGLLGIKILTLEEGKVTSRMDVTAAHLAPNGFLHAASIIALADTSCGVASFAHLPEGANNFTTIEIKSNHLGTVRDGTVICTATAQHLGKNTQVWDAVVMEEKSGKKLALFRCTQMVLRS